MNNKNNLNFLKVFRKEKKQLTNEVSEYFKIQKTYPDKEIFILCTIFLVKTLKNIKTLNPIRLLTYHNERRVDILARWILDRVDANYKKEAVVLCDKIISIPCDINNIKIKIEYLHKLYSTVLKFQNMNESDDEIESDEEFEDSCDISFAEYVFRYFRYNSKNPATLLDSKAFQFESLISGGELSIEDKMSLITSYCQAGKTFLVIPVTLIYIALGFTPVIIVLDTIQYDQLMCRLKVILENICKHLESLKRFSEKEISIFKDVLYYDSKNRVKNNDLELALNGERRRIIISLKQCSHLNRINKNWTENSNICLVPDEAQSSAAYKINTGTFHDENIQYENEFVLLKSRSKKYIPVSATVQDILMVDDKLWSDNLVYIPPNDDYRGIFNCKFVNIDVSEDEESQIIPLSTCRILEELSMTEPIVRYDRRNNKIDIHPINFLAKICRKVEQQHFILSCFATKQLPKKILNGNWTVLTLQGEGIRIYHDSLGSKPMKIKEQESVIKETGEHFFPSGFGNSINISDIYQFLAEKGVQLHPRIMTISYDMCCEAISFISHYDKPQNYHITHSTFKMSDTSNSSNVQQALSRSFGNHGDDIELTIYVTQKLKEKVIKGFELHDTQIKSLISLSQKGNTHITSNIICSEYLKSLEVMDNRVPTVYNRVKNLSLNKIKNSNKTKENKLMKSEKINCIDILSYMDPEKYDDLSKKIEQINLDANNRKISEGYEIKEKRVKSEDENKLNNVEHLEETSGLENVRQSYNSFKSNVVKRIINVFIEEDFRDIDSEKLKLYCGFKQPTNYTRWGGNNCYKIIERTVSGYKLRTEIIEYLNL